MINLYLTYGYTSEFSGSQKSLILSMAIILNYLFFNVPGHFFQIFGFLVVFAHKVCISNYLQKIPSVIVIQIKVNKKVL